MKKSKLSKKTVAALLFAAVVVLTALWFSFRSGRTKNDSVTFDRLPGISGDPTFTVAELLLLRENSDPLVLFSVTSENDPSLAPKLTRLLSSYGYLLADPDSVSADAVRISFAYGETSAAALEVRADSSVTVFGSLDSVTYRAVNREEVTESLYTALSRLITEG